MYEIDNLYLSEEMLKSRANQLKEDLEAHQNGEESSRKSPISHVDVGYDIRLVSIIPKERRWKKKKETEDMYGNELASDYVDEEN